jgi:hypothetical protein
LWKVSIGCVYRSNTGCCGACANEEIVEARAMAANSNVRKRKDVMTTPPESEGRIVLAFHQVVQSSVHIAAQRPFEAALQ